MTYEYACIGCGHAFDVEKSVKDMDVNEFCPKCEEPAARKFVPSRLHLSKTKVQHAEFNPGLGCVVKNAYERSEVAKRKGLTEIGNDFGSGEKVQQSFDTARAEKREKAWESVDV